MGDNKESGSIGICSNASYIKELITGDHAFSTLSEHTIDIFIPGKPLNSSLELVSDLKVSFLGEVILQQFNSLQHGLIQGKGEGLGRGYRKVWLWNWSLWDLL